MEVWVEVLELVHVEFSVSIELSQSPVVMEVAGECGIRMGVSGDWATDVRLWVLFSLSQSPVVMEVAAKG